MIALKNIKAVTIVVHLIIWSIMVNLIWLVRGESMVPTRDFIIITSVIFGLAIIFYGNYFILIPKFLFKKKPVIYAASNIVFYLIMIFLLREVKGLFDHDALQRELFAFGHPRMIFSFVLFTSFSIAIRTTIRWNQSEELRTILEKENLTSELLNLKNQLNPHFLFNTLNNIFGLVTQNPPVAQDAIHKLSKLMRYFLYESNERFVPLQKEVDFIHHYIDLMKIRTTANVNFEFEFPGDLMGATVAPLLFISLIENAFKHGINSSQTSSIYMKMELNTKRELDFVIKNTSFPKDDRDRVGSGIGVENLKKRLALLYPETSRLFIQEENGYYQVNLHIAL